jgi:hypothetical protein
MAKYLYFVPEVGQCNLILLSPASFAQKMESADSSEMLVPVF